VQALPAFTQSRSTIVGNQGLRSLAIVYILVLTVSLAGISTRPMEFLATIWPANAVLLGFFIRKPAYAGSLGWIAAFLGYITADFLTGGSFRFTLVLALINLAGVASAFLIYRRLPDQFHDTRHPMLILGILVISLCGASTATIAAGLLAFDMLDGTALENAMFWFCAELTNFIIILPLILTIPGGVELRTLLRKRITLSAAELLKVLPVVALILSMAIGRVIGGPGSFAFPVPALIWCALRYSIFTTAFTVLLVGMWEMFSINTGTTLIPATSRLVELDAITSIRLGVGLMALAPLAVSITNTSRLALIRDLDRAAFHDELTGLPNRRALMTWGQERLATQDDFSRGTGLLMIDLDKFKEINDVYGHATGDVALSHFAVSAGTDVRRGDLLCRWGGEEFAVLLLDVDEATTHAIADRILVNAERRPVPGPEGLQIPITVSIGAAWMPPDHPACIVSLLRAADTTLYQAKATGRNRLILTTDVPIIEGH
jgi:diguanylate cyclase (GGDEF)-like protein